MILVSLCNNISTFTSLFNAKAILLEEQQWYYLNYICKIKDRLYSFGLFVLMTHKLSWVI